MCGKSALNDSRQEVLQALQSAASLLLVSHERPDGDTLGCIAGLARAAMAAGKKVCLLVPDNVPDHYKFLFEAYAAPPEVTNDCCSPTLTVHPAAKFAELADAAELIVVIDTCALSQLESIAGELASRAGKTVVIDHHVTFDPIGRSRWIDTSAAAAGVLVAEAIEALGWPMRPPAAEALAVAILTDTGWMRFSNTDGRCLDCVARLQEFGVKLDKLYARLFQRDRASRLKLMARMLASLEFHCADRVAVMSLRLSDFAQAGAKQEETENLINEPLRVGSVEAVALLSETTEGVVRVSFRSRQVVDVSAVAGRFGGGGHARAAGARLKLDIDAARASVTAALIEAMGNS